MPNTITFEREKLNQAMYQKLKKFIMNKRHREAEERAQADYYKRLRKEREERRRQIKFSAESLENAKREIIETKKRISLLKVEKDAVFTRFKQITQECKFREAEIRARNQQVQVEKAGIYPDQFQNRSHQEALLMLSKAQHKNFGSVSSQDVINQTNALRKQVGQLYGTSQYPPSSAHGVHESPIVTQSGNHSFGPTSFAGLDKRQVGMFSPPQSQQQFSSRNLAEVAVSSLLGNRELSAQELQGISKYLAEFGAASGKLQSADIINAVNAGTMSAFLNNPKLAAAVAASLGSTTRASAATSVSTSSSTSAPLTSVGGTSLPPAPTGYRGSITTGQSAQQIQLAQQLAAQQQAAALYASRVAPQSQHDYSTNG